MLKIRESGKARGVAVNNVDLDVGKFNENDYFTYIAAGLLMRSAMKLRARTSRCWGTLHTCPVNGVVSESSQHTQQLLSTMRELLKRIFFGSVSNTKSVGGIVKLKNSGIELNDGLLEDFSSQSHECNSNEQNYLIF